MYQYPKYKAVINPETGENDLVEIGSELSPEDRAQLEKEPTYPGPVFYIKHESMAHKRSFDEISRLGLTEDIVMISYYNHNGFNVVRPIIYDDIIKYAAEYAAFPAMERDKQAQDNHARSLIKPRPTAAQIEAEFKLAHTFVKLPPLEIG